ncbi:PE family protein, partial [Mycobacterium kansasii]
MVTNGTCRYIVAIGLGGGASGAGAGAGGGAAPDGPEGRVHGPAAKDGAPRPGGGRGDVEGALL